MNMGLQGGNGQILFGALIAIGAMWLGNKIR